MNPARKNESENENENENDENNGLLQIIDIRAKEGFDREAGEREALERRYLTAA